MSRILCGKCKGYHESILEVRQCYGIMPQRTVELHAVKYVEQADGSVSRASSAVSEIQFVTTDGELMEDEHYHTPAWLAGDKPVVEDTPRRQAIQGDGYFSHDSVIYKVQESQTSGRLYAKALRFEEVEPMVWKTVGFEYAPGAVRNLWEDERLSKEEAAAFGKLYGICCICGRTLTNEESIAAGIGPICASKQGWL